MTPAVSICIPSYNQHEFVVRAIKSVYAQTFQNFEIIVTDDSDDDAVQDAIEGWKDDGHFFFHRNLVRLGSPENWNECLRRCRAPLVKFLHHDDWFATPDALQTFVQTMQSHPEIDLAFSASRACEDDGTLIFVHRPSSEQIESLRKNSWSLQFANIVGAPSTTIFRKCNDLFDKRLRWVVDVDAYLELLKINKHFIYIDEPLVCVSSNGQHQITQFYLRNTLLRCWEHIFLYNKRRPNFNGRFKGFKFLFTMLHSIVDRNVFFRLALRRKAEPRNFEERLAFEIITTKLAIASVMANLRRTFSRLFS